MLYIGLQIRCRAWVGKGRVGDMLVEGLEPTVENVCCRFIFEEYGNNKIKLVRRLHFWVERELV